MKKQFLALFLASAALFTSCSDDDDNGAANSSSREIKYEITGNFSGDIDVTYITASGGGTTAEVNSLPWEYEFTAAENSNGAGFSASGVGGTAGQEVELKIYQGGREVGSVEATANSSGIFVASAPSVVITD